MKMNPYSSQPSRAFWRTGVSERHLLAIPDLYYPKFPVKHGDKIATAGSCFAQHITNNMIGYGFNVLNVEPAPEGLDSKVASKFGYGLYSARYGNIYTIQQLLQLARSAFNVQPDKFPIWEKSGRFYDALRPSVEPEGLESPEEVTIHRRQHLLAVRRMFRSMDIFIFTLGLTEAWVDKRDGTVFPTVPGNIAGVYDPEIHMFKNFSFDETFRDFIRFRDLIHRRNNKARFLITVSPVPLTATAGREHVLCATMYSKSVLRAVAGELAHKFEDVDYFPSYEIVTSHVSRGFFYEPNLRSIHSSGVENVMRIFFEAHGFDDTKKLPKAPQANQPDAVKNDDVRCEEILLETFNNNERT